jgi:hypothetical protein
LRSTSREKEPTARSGDPAREDDATPSPCRAFGVAVLERVWAHTDLDEKEAGEMVREALTEVRPQSNSR